MWLGGDPEAIRRLAARVRALTETLEIDREIAARRLAAVEWEGSRATAFRQQSAHDFALYDRASGSLEDVAQALEHLASVLARRQEAVADLAADVSRTIEDVWADGLSGAGHILDVVTGGLL